MATPSIASLKAASPALQGELELHYGTSEVAMLSQVFEVACENGALFENGVRRAEGASFNPRPARIAQIILANTKGWTAETLASAILCCCKRDALTAFNTFSQQTIKICENFFSGHPESHPQSAIIALALSLDELRHLHMTAKPADERDKVVNRSIELCTKCRSISGTEKLIKLVEKNEDGSFEDNKELMRILCEMMLDDHPELKNATFKINNDIFEINIEK